MIKFKQWFKEKLVVGPYPFDFYDEDNKFLLDENKYDIIINVSDEFIYENFLFLKDKKIESFWFPMNEVKKDVGLNSLYGAMNILHIAEEKNKCVYLHCHAGVNRSPTVQAAYYYMRTSTHIENEYRLNRMCTKGLLPPKGELELFLFNLNLKLNDDSRKGGILDTLKIKYINNF